MASRCRAPRPRVRAREIAAGGSPANDVPAHHRRRVLAGRRRRECIPCGTRACSRRFHEDPSSNATQFGGRRWTVRNSTLSSRLWRPAPLGAMCSKASPPVPWASSARGRYAAMRVRRRHARLVEKGAARMRIALLVAPVVSAPALGATRGRESVETCAPMLSASAPVGGCVWSQATGSAAATCGNAEWRRRSS
jgi:hypothetical protein